MPSASKFTGNRLTAAMLPGGESIVTIASVAERTFDNGDEKLELSFVGTNKTFVLNVTNTVTLCDMFGDDYSGWLGKRITLYATKVDFAGKRVDAIRIREKAPGGDTATVTTARDQAGMDDFNAALAEVSPETAADCPF